MNKIICGLFAAIILSSCNSSDMVGAKPSIPSTGVYLGGILKEGQTTVSDFNATTGIKHAAFMEFVDFPQLLDTKGADFLKVSSFIAACKAANAIPALTLETNGGLESYSTDDIDQLAVMLNTFDVSMFLRWNHEMNGSWYAWGQQPTLYIQKFREFTDIIHANAPNVAMAWTPNQGWGYAWPGLPYSISPTSPDFAILDTNHDGVLNESDDPYGPYYPGDDYVDWVGMSYYHWSNVAEKGLNQVPYDTQWGQSNGIDNAIPNFHDVFAVGHNKPMMIAETSAFYDPQDTKHGGAEEADIKNKWILEVYNLTDDLNPKIDVSLPKIHAIFWFSELKFETEVSGDVDWRLNINAAVADYYYQTVSNSYFIQAP